MMEISLISPINQLGYGKCGIGIVDSLISRKVRVNLFLIGPIECEQKYSNNIQQAIANTDNFNIDAPCIRLWHQHDLAMFVGRGEHIGFIIFELDTFTERELHHINNCDRIFVCSHWAEDIVRKNLLKLHNAEKNINVIPLGVDDEIFYAQESTRNSTIFINIGKWETRKGHDILVNMFNQAFSEQDDVELWMLCNNPFYNNEQNIFWNNKYKNSKLGHKIRILPRQQSSYQVADIMRQVDCGVFPSRAEGWNLELLELLSCGKHVIATNYAGHTEFCLNNSVNLVDINGLEPAYGLKDLDDRWFFGQGNWGKIDNTVEEKFIDNMRNIHELKQKGHLNINNEGIETSKNFLWSSTAKKILEIID